jgi:hypothetical protein
VRLHQRKDDEDEATPSEKRRGRSLLPVNEKNANRRKKKKKAKAKPSQFPSAGQQPEDSEASTTNNSENGEDTIVDMDEVFELPF